MEEALASALKDNPDLRVANAKLSEAELLSLAERARAKSFKRGETLFRKDDPGTHLYVVLEGSVKIALPGEFGQEALVSIMRKGDFFGELALFDGSPRSASATIRGQVSSASPTAMASA